MSGDLRAKKNTRLFNKAGGNKKENSKKALDLQTSGVDEEYRDEDFNEDAITNTKDAYEGIEDDRIITTKPIRKTKRRELNKHKQQGRHHRQQTPPPPSYYGIDEDIANDEYDNGTGVGFQSTLCSILGGLVILLCILGACLIVIRKDGYQKVLGSSESIKALVASTIVLPDFQDFHNHINMETVNAMAATIQKTSSKGWKITGETLHQFSISSKETCSNIINFLNTLVSEIKTGAVFKDTSTSPLEASKNPNDDSEDYTPELNDWIESIETPKDDEDVKMEGKDFLQENENSKESRDSLDTSKEPDISKTPINTKDHVEHKETIVAPSFQDVSEESSIKVAAVAIDSTSIDDKVVDEPVIQKTTVHTLG